MKNLSFIKYIMSLREKERTTAILLIAISALWGQGLWDKHAFNRLQDNYRKEILMRSDDCDAQKMKLMNDNNDKINLIRAVVDSLIKENSSIIKSNNERYKHYK